MSQPPSFEPRNRRQRPSVEGARPVGQSREQASQPRTGQGRPLRTDAGKSAPSAGAPRRPIRRSAFANKARPASFAPSSGPASASGSASASAPAPAAESARPTQGPVTPPPSYLPQGQFSEGRYRADQSRVQSVDHPSLVQPGLPERPSRPRKRRSWGKRILALILAVLIAILAWVFYLYGYGNDKLTHASALSGAPDTPGTTYLIVGSDERGEAVNDPTEGHRADTIMLLHKPESGPAALVSIPRDTLVHYPDSDANGKLNGAFSYGGAQYLVQTVEELTGLTIDRYIQIGMDGVKELTDAVGGVELCLDYDVSDEYSGLQWTAGCHVADGTTALSFSRMRYSDPLGDIGRTERQRQVVAKILGKALSPATILNPFAQRRLVGSVAETLTVDDDASLMDVGYAGLALRDTIGPDGLKGAPPIASLNYPGPGGSSTVLLADEAEQFWIDLRDGTLTPDSFASF
ncbi:MAG: LCP family protein [Trueperella sp.]|uniref:LCP family protein n=1 Tax=Trueperella sp. TaxID=2699835 RepID=UPI002A919E34|nr:LCP family protein [Trueperella sp.]MDY5403088.1 LCP family protein [Trueperella sp.]